MINLKLTFSNIIIQYYKKTLIIIKSILVKLKRFIYEPIYLKSSLFSYIIKNQEITI